MKIQDPINNQTLMKSNAQLRREDKDDASQPPPIHVPDIRSSSQTAPPPPQQDTGYAQIHAVGCFFYATVCFFYATGGSLRHPRVSQAPPSV
jgi:hypothetical protein